MAFNIEYFCINALGCVRRNNEDNFFSGGQFRPLEATADISFSGFQQSDENRIVAVYDGMGGEACGEVASYIAASGTASFHCGSSDNPASALQELCDRLNAEICDYAQRNHTGVTGTTAAILLFHNKGVYACNLGDSHIYRLRGGRLKLISTEHVLQGYPGKKAPLTQFLGVPSEEFAIEPYITRSNYKVGDVFLTCSDGLTDMVEDRVITEIIMKNSSPEAAARELEALAKANGGRDNITMQLCYVRSGSGEGAAPDGEPADGGIVLVSSANGIEDEPTIVAEQADTQTVCKNCGRPLGGATKFCGACGAPTGGISDRLRDAGVQHKSEGYRKAGRQQQKNPAEWMSFLPAQMRGNPRGEAQNSGSSSPKAARAVLIGGIAVCVLAAVVVLILVLWQGGRHGSASVINEQQEAQKDMLFIVQNGELCAVFADGAQENAEPASAAGEAVRTVTTAAEKQAAESDTFRVTENFIEDSAEQGYYRADKLACLQKGIIECFVRLSADKTMLFYPDNCDVSRGPDYSFTLCCLDVSGNSVKREKAIKIDERVTAYVLSDDGGTVLYARLPNEGEAGFAGPKLYRYVMKEQERIPCDFEAKEIFYFNGAGQALYSAQHGEENQLMLFDGQASVHIADYYGEEPPILYYTDDLSRVFYETEGNLFCFTEGRSVCAEDCLDKVGDAEPKNLRFMGVNSEKGCIYICAGYDASFNYDDYIEDDLAYLTEIPDRPDKETYIRISNGDAEERASNEVVEYLKASFAVSYRKFVSEADASSYTRILYSFNGTSAVQILDDLIKCEASGDNANSFLSCTVRHIKSNEKVKLSELFEEYLNDNFVWGKASKYSSYCQKFGDDKLSGYFAGLAEDDRAKDEYYVVLCGEEIPRQVNNETGKNSTVKAYCDRLYVLSRNGTLFCGNDTVADNVAWFELTPDGALLYIRYDGSKECQCQAYYNEALSTAGYYQPDGFVSFPQLCNLNATTTSYFGELYVDGNSVGQNTVANSINLSDGKIYFIADYDSQQGTGVLFCSTADSAGQADEIAGNVTDYAVINDEVYYLTDYNLQDFTGRIAASEGNVSISNVSSVAALTAVQKK